MKLIMQWFREHNLQINVTKTKILPFCMNSKQLPEEQYLTIHESTNCQEPCACPTIDIVENMKYLGLEIDCFLKWDKHIDALTKRLRRYIYPFLTLRNFLSLNLLKEVYHALVQSAIEYGICAYGRADKNTLHKLEVVQKSLLKIIYWKTRRFSTSELFKQLSILNVEKLFTKNICTYIHRNRKDLVKYTEHKYKLRTRNLQFDRYKTSKGQKSIKFLGLKQYDQIPENIKIITDIGKFKLELKNSLKKSLEEE